VKNGVLADYNTTTVGKAFGGTFENPTFIETAKGIRLVDFSG